MAKLQLGLEVRDFDLERMGFSLSVLDETGQRQLSEGYLRMTLQELGVFVDALKGAQDDVKVTGMDTGLKPFVQIRPLQSLVAAE